MENALLIGLSRQIALHREIDVVANNIANVNTTGYKADSAIFEEFLMPIAHHGHFLGGDRRLSYVQDRATWHDFKPGPLKQTGNPLDVAIEGDAFLVVQTPRGERYTRNGALQINATGQLVTAEGHRGAERRRPDPVSEHRLQHCHRRRRHDQGARKRRQPVRRAARQAAAGPLRSGRTAAKGRIEPVLRACRRRAASRRRERVRVIQGALEQSNVRGVVEMSRMIELTRTYQQIANLLQSHGDMRRNTIDKLAEVPA